MADKNDRDPGRAQPQPSAGNGPASIARRGSRIAAVEYAAAIACCVLEGLIGLAALEGSLAVGWLLLGHLAVVGVLAAWVRHRLANGAEGSSALLLLIFTFVAGPIGAAGALATLPFLGGRDEHSELLDSWYERISNSTAVEPEAKLAESILSGRTLETSAPPPQHLYGIMLRGSLVERQKALGLIARRFDPAYGLALKAALKSPEPVVRVQAAAVAARVRGALKSDVRAALGRLAEVEGDPVAAAKAAAHLEGCAASGLLDEGDRVRAEAAVTRLRAAIARTASGAAAGPRSPIPRLPASLAAAREFERGLIAAGAFRQLRVGRRLDRLTRLGLKVRPLDRRAGRRGAAVATAIAPTAHTDAGAL